MDNFSVEDLCRASGLSPEDATLLLQEVGGDLGLALMLVKNTLTHGQVQAQSANPEVTELRKAIDACSGDAGSVQDLMASIQAFEKGDAEGAISLAQAAHHPLWHKLPQPALVVAVDKWIASLRPGESESEIYGRAQRQGPKAVVLDVGREGRGD